MENTIVTDKGIRAYIEGPFWQHYLSLENSLKEISEYVHLDSRNKDVFSFKIMQLYFTACSEIDSIFEHIQNNLGRIYKNNIKANIKMLFELFPEIANCKIIVKENNWEFTPFAKIAKSDKAEDIQLQWWTDYSHVKHHRIDYYHKANLNNLLHAFSALFILNALYTISGNNNAVSNYKDVLFHISAENPPRILNKKESGFTKYVGGMDYYSFYLTKKFNYF